MQVAKVNDEAVGFARGMMVGSIPYRRSPGDRYGSSRIYLEYSGGINSGMNCRINSASSVVEVGTERGVPRVVPS
jgi:hypothetical protein